MPIDRDKPFDDLTLNEKVDRARFLEDAEARGELTRNKRELAEAELTHDEFAEDLASRNAKIEQAKRDRKFEAERSSAWSEGCLAIWLASAILGFATYVLGSYLGITFGGSRLAWIWIAVTAVVSFWFARRSERELKNRYSPSTRGHGIVGDYREYLRSDQWKSTRNAALHRAGHRCQVCGTHGGRLEVHHNTYRNLGNEQPEDLIVLCRDCHQRFHQGGRLPVD